MHLNWVLEDELVPASTGIYVAWEHIHEQRQEDKEVHGMLGNPNIMEWLKHKMKCKLQCWASSCKMEVEVDIFPILFL